jgi:hypothetical protein
MARWLFPGTIKRTSIKRKMQMIMSAIIDPNILCNIKYSDQNHKKQTEIFLNGILTNGLLIVDDDGKLLSEIIDNTFKLSSTTGQLTRILIEELLKNGRKYLLQLQPSKISTSLVTLINILSGDAKCDAIVTSTLNMNKYSVCKPGEVTNVENYSTSNFEINRRYYVDKISPIDSLTCDQLTDIVDRAIGYSKNITFFDKYIGHGSSTSNFRKTLEFVLDLWKLKGLFASKDNNCVVNIVTCPPHRLLESDMPHITTSKIDSNKKAINKVELELMARLRRKYNWKFNIYWKVDTDDIFHARHLDSDYCIALVERGFDLIKTDGSAKRCIVKLDSISTKHLQQCYSMKNYAV